MRGDPPIANIPAIVSPRSTPHARGSTLYPSACLKSSSVYPACAGIHLKGGFSSVESICLPRMRGDPPLPGYEGSEGCGSTPHARGSTPVVWSLKLCRSVYPACAGIHLPFHLGTYRTSSLPRMCGDPPVIRVSSSDVLTSTPHARGSTHGTDIARQGGGVYPACAGIHRVGRIRL